MVQQLVVWYTAPIHLKLPGLGLCALANLRLSIDSVTHRYQTNPYEKFAFSTTPVHPILIKFGLEMDHFGFSYQKNFGHFWVGFGSCKYVFCQESAVCVECWVVINSVESRRARGHLIPMSGSSKTGPIVEQVSICSTVVTDRRTSY